MRLGTETVATRLGAPICRANDLPPSLLRRLSAQGGLAALLTSSHGSGDAATEAVQVMLAACLLWALCMAAPCRTFVFAAQPIA